MDKALNSGGHVIIAAFAIDGPPKCSGLNVERYNDEKLKKELGNSFKLVKNVAEVHVTPAGTEQKFTYYYFRKLT